MTFNSTYLTEHRDNAKDKIDTDFQYFCVGDDDTAATATDTTLGNELFRDTRDAVDKTTFPAEISVTGELSSAEYNGNDVVEFGWSKSPNTDEDIEQHIVLTGASFTKTSDIAVVVETNIEVEVTEEEV